MPCPSGGHVAANDGVGEGVGRVKLPKKGVFVEYQTLGSFTLIAYAVSGGANSDGYPIRLVMTPVAGALGCVGALAAADAVGVGVDAVGVADGLCVAATGLGRWLKLQMSATTTSAATAPAVNRYPVAFMRTDSFRCAGRLRSRAGS